MPNAVLMAARLAGQPLLMRPREAEAYAAQLLAHDGRERRSGFGAFLEAARRAAFGPTPAAAPEAAACAAPSAYYPRWLEASAGVADGEGVGWALKDGVALIEVSGPLVEQGFGYWSWDGDSCWINGYDTLGETFAQVAADERVRGVFVYWDSPGGVSSPLLGALADQIRALSVTKPVFGYCRCACSAAYWLASGCTRLMAPGLGEVGSIGAVAMHCDQSGALEKDGFKVTYIQFGSKKTDGSPYKPLSEQALADWQADIDHLGDLIVSGVVAGRPNLSPEAVIAQQADYFFAVGGTPARSGLDLGLVDAVGSEAEAFAALLATLSTPIPAPGAGNASMETEMKRTTLEAILADASLTTPDALRTSLQAALDAAAAKTDDDETEDEDEDGAGGGGDDDEPEPAKKDEMTAPAPAGEVVLAILDLPEAKGREKLARTLAGQAGMTVATAKIILGAAPKGSNLSERMEGRDPKVSATAEAASGDEAAAAFILNAHAAATGKSKAA